MVTTSRLGGSEVILPEFRRPPGFTDASELKIPEGPRRSPPEANIATVPEWQREDLQCRSNRPHDSRVSEAGLVSKPVLQREELWVQLGQRLVQLCQLRLGSVHLETGDV